MNRIPPPPGWQRVRSRHEEKVLRQYHPLGVSAARWCERMTRGRLEYGDALSEVQEAVVAAARQYAQHNNGSEIPGPLVNVVIRRKACNLLRDQRACGRNATVFIEDVIKVAREEERTWSENKSDVIVDWDQETQHEAVERMELEAACRALAYALRHGLSPAGFAVLHLRHVEDLTPDEITALAGKKRKGWWRYRRDIVKRQARDYLRSIGITEWEDVTELHARHVHV